MRTSSGRARVDEGWTGGRQPDVRHRKSPFLVPYDALPEAEKEVDRTLVRGTLHAAVALGCVIETPPPRCSAEEARAIAAWEERLETPLRSMQSSASDRRERNYDLDDADEIASSESAAFPALRAALLAFQERLHPAWKAADARANELHGAHRSVAKWAIWPGIAAILLGSVRAELDHQGTLSTLLAAAELVTAALAAAAVARGLTQRTRDRWLTARQSAERLRVAKFRALADELLWTDAQAWRERWSAEVDRLAQLTPEEAKAWVSGGSAEPRIPEPSSVRIPPAELAALSAYYRSKRQEFQHHYFAKRAGQHRDDMWMLRLKVPIWLFAASVGFVLLHVISELYEKIAQHGDESAPFASEPSRFGSVVLVMAAVLPSIGFGLRAWLSAFELPRRANLFESKATQLSESIERMKADRDHPRRTLTHIELGEHFFESEHREWCRLILESEWFV